MEELSKGLLIRPQRLNDWALGGLTPLDFKFNNPDGNWTSYLPTDEFQNRWSYDRMACTTYSILNCLEVLHFKQTGIGKNFSDRFIAKASGTTRQGNYLDTVFDTIRKIGLIEEYLYTDDAKSWDEYYKEIPQELFDNAKEFLNDWNLYREWVRTDRKEDILLALKSAPLQVTVRYASGNGLLMPDGDWNHAVMMYKAEEGVCWYIFDHYTQTRKKYAWDYEFGSVLKPSLIKKTNNINMFKKDHAYQLVQGNSQKTGLYVDGKGLYIGDSIDVLVNSAMRLKTDYIPTPIPTTLDDWNKVGHYDLKGNLIS